MTQIKIRIFSVSSAVTNPNHSEDAADDELRLLDAEEVFNTEIRDAVAAEDHDRERYRMPAGYQQLQPPTNTRADDGAKPQFYGVRNGQPGMADALVETAAEQNEFQPACQPR